MVAPRSIRIAIIIMAGIIIIILTIINTSEMTLVTIIKRKLTEISPQGYITFNLLGMGLIVTVVIG